ncbi:hypothetical protein OID55_41290 [Streptomyces sp. NBC_00715]|uniref:UvrD-helicase domain-containing protein n=1 Tax=Streptomyces sp. NBC_00715 TaxID=2975811 RepID=UPI00386E4653
MASGEAMSMSVTGTPELTDAQHHVVEEPAQCKALITAGAGTCKTLTLVRQIEHLGSEALAGGDSLVVTFSRTTSACCATKGLRAEPSAIGHRAESRTTHATGVTCDPLVVRQHPRTRRPR